MRYALAAALAALTGALVLPRPAPAPAPEPSIAAPASAMYGGRVELSARPAAGCTYTWVVHPAPKTWHAGPDGPVARFDVPADSFAATLVAGRGPAGTLKTATVLVPVRFPACHGLDTFTSHAAAGIPAADRLAAAAALGRDASTTEAGLLDALSRSAPGPVFDVLKTQLDILGTVDVPTARREIIAGLRSRHR